MIKNVVLNVPMPEKTVTEKTINLSIRLYRYRKRRKVRNEEEMLTNNDSASIGGFKYKNIILEDKKKLDSMKEIIRSSLPTETSQTKTLELSKMNEVTSAVDIMIQEALSGSITLSPVAYVVTIIISIGVGLGISYYFLKRKISTTDSST